MPEPEAALYDVVPEQFIAARAALVRELRSAGDKPEAARVAKLRRPPLTTWALNQVARTDPVLIDELLGAGRGLRAAMEQALGGDASELRTAQAGERSAVDAVVAEAVRRLEHGGYTATNVMLQRMAATLRAAIVDESVAALLGHGVLDADRDAPGFGMDALAAPLTVAPEEEEEEAATSQPDRTAAAERAQRHHEAQLDAERLAAEARRLVAEADRLAGEAKEAVARAAEARTRADAARQAAAARQTEADRLAPDEA